VHTAHRRGADKPTEQFRFSLHAVSGGLRRGWWIHRAVSHSKPGFSYAGWWDAAHG